jgi:hypothetical protein
MAVSPSFPSGYSNQYGYGAAFKPATKAHFRSYNRALDNGAPVWLAPAEFQDHIFMTAGGDGNG